MQHVSKEMQACIDECMGCYKVRLGMAMTHCLERGGKHVEPKHFRLMMACAEICRTSAHFHADRHSASQAYLPRVRRDLRGVREELRSGWRHGGVR